MPELPEVQTIVNDLKKQIIGFRILDVWSDAPRLVKKPPFLEFKKEIKNLKILDIHRRGKNILIRLDKNKMLLIHQKLTGHLLIGRWQIKNQKVIPLIPGPLKESVNNYIHLIFYLNNNKMLALSDLRKFAKVILGSNKEVESLPDLKNLGVEPLNKDFTFSVFSSLISQEKRKIKTVLMDQKIISGIGNIYSDEMLWLSKIHPLSLAYQLSIFQQKKLYSALKKVLKSALYYRGSSVDDYRDPFGQEGHYSQKLRVYRRNKKPCFRCGHLIEKIKLQGRSAYFCPYCQKQ